MERKEIWVFAELVDNRPAKVFYELQSKACEIAAEKGWTVASVVIGNELTGAIEDLKNYSEKVYAVQSERFGNYTLQKYAEAFADLAREYKPEMILTGATGIGSELAPTVAAKLKTGLAAHCIDIKVDNNMDRINCMVPAFGGKVVSEIYIPEARPMMASIRPGILDDEQRTMECKDVVEVNVPATDDPVEEFIDFIPNIQTGKKVDESDVVVAVGRGISREESWNDANAIADKLDGAVGWTRAFIDTGIVDNETQMIGTSGKSVKPNVFLGLGISGAAHFTCGMAKSKLIINVNRDKNASIFQYSDYGVVGDAAKFMKALLTKLQ